MGEFTPKSAKLNDDVLFGGVRSREELSPHQRSVVTLSTLIPEGDFEQLPAHLRIGKQNNAASEEIVRIVTHLASYVGWPEAQSALSLTKEIYLEKDSGDKKEA